MKKLLNTFLMTMVASVPLCISTLAADSQMNFSYPTVILTEEEAYMKMDELIASSRVSEEDFTQLAHFFLTDSDQILVVDCRKKCNLIPVYKENGFQGHCDQASAIHNENINDYLTNVFNCVCERIEDGQYQINQFSLDILQAMAQGEFIDSFEQRYARFRIADSYLLNELFVDQFKQ